MNFLTPKSAVLTKPIPIISDKACARPAIELSLTRWAFGIAIGSLILAGGFSLFLVVGRLPMFAHFFTDPLFFRRCLVLHVDLALIVWFFSFAVGLYSLLPGNRASNNQLRIGLSIATAGCAAMIAGTMIPGTAPVLANYVPVIDNAVYVSGLAMFFGGLLVCFISDRLFIRWNSNALDLHDDARVGLKAVAVGYAIAMTTFLAAVATTPRELDAKSYYELVFWGGGHVLQVANIAAMVAVWLYLLGSILKRPVMSATIGRVVFALLLAPHFLAPLLTVNGTLGPLYRQGFTRLMQFGIAPMVLIALGICIRAFRRELKAGAINKRVLLTPAFMGFCASAALTITGFLLGSAIRNSNTMIPAHYHASIGAVTVAFMAVGYLLLPRLGFSVSDRRWARFARWQLPLFGFGQVVFAIGFALGGMHGLSRKAYGAEQHIRTAWEWIGLLIMGAGGLVAVAGGLLFLALMIWAVWPRHFLNFRRTGIPMIARIHS